ncbi:AzlD domain-containing protein [Bosea sp. (in: a-proteobacteria)]|uniref:AzlD domain-containing protein n=1 Tax=Bosea sp. (in: a-proteobacteria) TaxID=1871050 RepID=UPI00333EDAA1
MTQPIAWLDGPHWPYLALILFAVLPTEIWRWLAVAFARGLDADSALLDWVRAVATALLAGIVAKLVVSPPGVLAQVPVLVRVAALAAAVAVMALSRRRMMLAVLMAEAVLIGGVWLFGTN